MNWQILTICFVIETVGFFLAISQYNHWKTLFISIAKNEQAADAVFRLVVMYGAILATLLFLAVTAAGQLLSLFLKKGRHAPMLPDQ